MAFQLSPGVNVTEIDLTTVVPAVATSDGAIGGVFRWGPIGQRVLVDSENTLVARFGKPTNFNAETFFSAANFLSYANRLYVSRAANTSGSTPVANAALNRYVANLYIANTVANSVTTVSGGSGYTNTDIIRCTTNTAGGNATATLTTNSTGGITNVVLTSAGYGFLTSSPTVTAVSNTGTPSTGAGANIQVTTALSNNVFVVLGVTNTVALGLSNDLYVYRASSNAASYGANVTVINSVAFSLSTNTTWTGNTQYHFAHHGTSYTAVALEGSGVVANLTNQIVKNENEYINNDGNFDADILYVAKYPGAIGNSLEIAVCDTADGFNSSVNTAANVVFTIGESDAVAVFTGTSNVSAQALVDHFSMGDQILAGNSSIGLQYMQLEATAVTTNATHTIATFSFQDPYRLHTNYTTSNVSRYWQFFNVVDTAPGQSNWVMANGNTAAQDELHVVVFDNQGQFTGTPGTVLEVYKGLSRSTDAKNADGTGNYYKEVINQNSKYIWWANDRTSAVSANASMVASASNTTPLSIGFVYGSDGYDESNVSLGTVASAYDLFASAEDVDVSLVIQGKPIGGTTSVGGYTVQNFQLANYIIDNICETRKDCIALISPDVNTVLNNYGDEALTLKAWRGALRDSSYAVLDSGYKYQYDRYNDVYRWIPLNADIAGLCVRTDNTNDAWWSPAGFNRGQIKNIVKLAWSPRKSERDVLYVNGINPVVTFPGQGTLLYGDKTLLSKPSAFDRINVRRLFIVLEKAISTAAKYSLFEFNDAFTRSQFKNLVNPYLRTIQGRRGITDYKVVCDETNNTPQVIDTNQFVGDIYIKPARSINFIQLNFVAVGTGVQFSEVVGKF